MDQVPNEVLHQILICIPPQSIPAVQLVSWRFHNLCQPLLWRHYCRTLYEYWSSEHKIKDKFASDVSQVDWKTIFIRRHEVDKVVSDKIERILSKQIRRITETQDIVSFGYDAKDTILRHGRTEWTAEDVLARRFHSDVVLGSLHRAIAVREWVKLAQGEEIPLERALMSFDMFVLHDGHSDLDQVAAKIERTAQASGVAEITNMSTRSKATALATFLRKNNLVGIRTNVNANYHNMQNNFIGMALEDPDHPSLPLISVAIYCCMAQRLGIDARPCGFPFHVLAVIKAPCGKTLDGHDGDDGEQMYLDPFRSDNEMAIEELRSQLMSLGISEGEGRGFLDASSTNEIVRRAAKNIITSVQTLSQADRLPHNESTSSFPDVDSAFYAALWALMILADGSPAAVKAQRIQFLPYLLQHLKDNHPTDVGLVVSHILPLFEQHGLQQMISATITDIRHEDSMPKQIKHRTMDTMQSVNHSVGQFFRHRRYSYFAFIIGWDLNCRMDERWQSRMRISELARGKHQSFYHVQDEEGSMRYVAEDNIEPCSEKPSDRLMALAGRYFKRWDRESNMFVSNIKDQYPDD